ncbi:MAG: Fe-S cluster assembly protein SufD, partial [Acidobacteriota bacterium]
MTAVREPHALLTDNDAFLASFDTPPASIAALRARGHEAFSTLGFPSKRQEAWRFTSPAPIARQEFSWARPVETDLDRARVEPFFLDAALELVFVNGRFAPHLSDDTSSLGPGVWAGSMARALTERPEIVADHLAQYAPLDEHPFAALNAAHLADGAFIHVPRGVVVEQAIHLLFVSLPDDGRPVAAYPRNLIVAEENSQVTVIESYTGYSGDVGFTCPVTEIVGKQASVIDHYKLQQESTAAFHVAVQQVYLEKSANFFNHHISHGAALARTDTNAMLDGEGIECTLNGLYLGRGTQHVDNHMKIDHKMPNCNSYELFKGIMEDRSKAVFDGLIYVWDGAQKTDAKQSNRNLLLSDAAVVHSNPQLEIFADDVRCTHGSTTGHLEDEALFYLRSRGIGMEAAQSLLTYAFAAEVLAEIRHDQVRKDLEDF